ncbi:MAG: PLP-dependent transferase [Vicinamibacterales bacterium]
MDVVVASGTKALSGTDRDLWGYVATSDTPTANAVMDLMAMRGGILDWRRAGAILAEFDHAGERHARRCETAARVAAFLAGHPRVAEVFHPSLASHPDADVVARGYRRTGSMVSFRVAGADEAATRHAADVLATTTIVRYALSFDGWATKVNHHQTVSEYFTPAEQLRRNGFDRLIRLGVGLEDAGDLIAALNWALHHASAVGPEAVAAWQQARAAALAGDAMARTPTTPTPPAQSDDPAPAGRAAGGGPGLKQPAVRAQRISHHRHEPHVHVELVVAMEQGQPGLIRRHVDLHLFPRRHHHHVLHEPARLAAVNTDQLEGVAVQVDRVGIGALVVERPPHRRPASTTIRSVFG